MHIHCCISVKIFKCIYADCVILSFPLWTQMLFLPSKSEVFPFPWIRLTLGLAWPGEFSERMLWNFRVKALRELMASASTLLEAIRHRKSPISWDHSTEKTKLDMGRGLMETVMFSHVHALQPSQVRQQTWLKKPSLIFLPQETTHEAEKLHR